MKRLRNERPIGSRGKDEHVHEMRSVARHSNDAQLGDPRHVGSGAGISSIDGEQRHLPALGPWQVGTMLTLSGPRRRTRRLIALCSVGLATLALPAAPAQAAHPSALWRVVHDLCVPDRKLFGLAAPCIAVDLQTGYAIVPDPGERYDLLVVPTVQMTGIEDPHLLAAGSPNYWRFAWFARLRLAHRVGADIPRRDVGMAVNAVAGRTQNQLHIHLSCIRPEVAAALQASASSLSERWSTVTIAHGAWRVRLVADQNLSDHDPFKLMAADSGVAADLGSETLVAVGAALPNGQESFYLLHRATDVEIGSYGAGERLLDEKCSSVRK